MLLTMTGITQFVTIQTSRNKHVGNFQQIRRVCLRTFDSKYKLCDINKIHSENVRDLSDRPVKLPYQRGASDS